jgi:hypothetical protein
MNQAEPPSPRSSSHSSLFHIGKDSHGHWVVQDQEGLRGGLFVDRAEALKFAMFENGNRPQAVIMVPGILELDVKGRSPPAERAGADTPARLQRRA